MSENPVVGEYELIHSIASGTFTQIWEAAHPSHPEHAIVKLMLPAAMEDRENIQVLRHEAKIGAQLEHPNIVQLYEFNATKTEAYIAMEFFRAPNVKTQISTDINGLQLRFRRLVEGTCLALDHMHSLGWVHKDVKPDNVLSNKAGEVKLIDFSLAVKVRSGIGKLLGGKIKTIQGTRTYIAPETILKKPSTPATDVYSLGVMLFEVLTGVAPFLGSSPNDLLKRHLAEKPPEPSVRNPNVTDELDRVIVRMLAKKPANRPQSMSEVYNEIRNIPLFREEIVVGEDKEEDLDLEDTLSNRLDSRNDAKRTAAGITMPARPKPKAKPKPEPKPAAPVAAQPPPTQPQPPPQQPYPPQGYPQQPYPGQPYPPGQYPGQQPYPGQPYPPQGYPQGYPQGAPPQGVPPQGYPPQPPPPGYPTQQPPQGQQPTAPPQQPAQPAGQQPATPPPAAPPAKTAPNSQAPPKRKEPEPTEPEPVDEKELPLWDDLPDII